MKLLLKSCIPAERTISIGALEKAVWALRRGERRLVFLLLAGAALVSGCALPPAPERTESRALDIAETVQTNGSGRTSITQIGAFPWGDGIASLREDNRRGEDW